MQELSRVVAKYLFSIILLALSILILATSSGQSNYYVYGGIGLLVVSILSFLYIKGLLSLQVNLIIALIFGAGALAFAYFDYQSIQNELVYQRKKEKIEDAVIQRLKDIRAVQLAYNKEFGRYASSFDTLENFLRTGEITLIKRLGSLPDTVPTEEMAREMGLIVPMPAGMTDQAVLDSGLIVRDTLSVPVMGQIFKEEDRKERSIPFYIDSLSYVPYSDHQFVLATDIVESGGVSQSVFLARDPQPFATEFRVGSLTEASTSGNWKE